MSHPRPVTGRVSLVGGGPGDLELLTLKAVRLLREADVVVVDRLAPRDGLAELAPGAELVDVGKSPGHHAVPQEQINALLVEHAVAGRRVVRLKGGDPYVFGRGGEELAACRTAGVPVEVVPGVTSAFAVPAAAGIPVTHRGLARSVTVITGHDQLSPQQLQALVGLGGTIVVLMGATRLAHLVGGLLAKGMSPDLPAAMVERGWTEHQRTTTARLADLPAAALARGVSSPAVIVVGEVAALADDPTAGTTVGSALTAAELCEPMA
jgi:uroporphyrin-III C-methyltransferase